MPVATPAAMFTARDGTPGFVSASCVSTALQRAARSLGEDPRMYSTHSLRAGGATNMYRAGVDALTIQFHGRWASDAFKTYTRLCSESVSTVAARMVCGASMSTTLQ
jgi:integrase